MRFSARWFVVALIGLGATAPLIVSESYLTSAVTVRNDDAIPVVAPMTGPREIVEPPRGQDRTRGVHHSVVPLRASRVAAAVESPVAADAATPFVIEAGGRLDARVHEATGPPNQRS